MPTNIAFGFNKSVQIKKKKKLQTSKIYGPTTCVCVLQVIYKKETFTKFL